MRRGVIWTLLFLYGPASLVSLFALPGQPECRMVCCQRKHAAHTCDLHRAGSQDTSPARFEISADCPPDCATAAVLPTIFGVSAAAIRAGGPFLAADGNQTASTASPFRSSTARPFLYQRPPPRR